MKTALLIMLVVLAGLYGSKRGLGPELLSNGTFIGDDGFAMDSWTVEDVGEIEWISGDAFIWDDSLLSASVTLTQGKRYKVTYRIIGHDGVDDGTIRAALGGTDGTERSSNGTYTDTLTAGAGSSLIFTLTSPDDGFSIDYVSVKKSSGKKNIT